MKKKFVRFLIIPVLTAMFFLAPAAHSDYKVTDSLKRDYKISLLDPEAGADPNDRRSFHISEFTTWTAMEKMDNRDVIVLHREEKSKQGDKVDWKIYIDPQNLSLLRAEHTTVSREGKPLDQGVEYYENSLQKYPPGTIHFQMLSWVLQYADLKPGCVLTYNFVFNPSYAPWKLTLRHVGEEAIVTPGGSYMCIKLELEYSTDQLPGFFKYLPNYFLKKMMSGYYMWVEKAAPHAMIRFQGQIDGWGSPEKVQELVKVRK